MDYSLDTAVSRVQQTYYENEVYANRHLCRDGWKRSGRSETYEHGLVRALAEIARKTSTHLFCLQAQAAQSFGIVQENVKYQLLRPNFRWISIPFAFPFGVMRSGLDILHPPFVPRLTGPSDSFTVTDSICSHTGILSYGGAVAVKPADPHRPPQCPTSVVASLSGQEFAG